MADRPKAERQRLYDKVHNLKSTKRALRKRYKTKVGNVLVVNPRTSARPDKEPVVEMMPATVSEMEEINDDYAVVEDDYCIYGPPANVQACWASEYRDISSEVESSDPESDDSIA